MTIKDYKDGLKENTRGFVDELKTIFPDLRVTSGFRPRAFTKQGNMSRHALGEAIDIAPDKKVYDYLWNTKEGIALLDKYGLGVLDETTPEMLEKTGGTGAHYHIGMDSTLAPKTKARYKELWGDVEEKQSQPIYITPDFTNLETPIQTPTFAEQEQEVDKDVAEVEQKTNEYNFLEELYKSPQRQEEQQQEQVQQAPQTNLLESFAQISEFVEAPLFQQGGTWQQQQARVKAEKDAKLRELLKDRDVVKRLKEESAQRGTQPTTERTTTQVDATKTVRTNNPDKTSLTARNKTDKEIAEERQTRIDAQTQANAQPFDWSNFRQSLADRSQATGDALRVSNEPNLFDDYLNPFAMIGSMADNLGQAPLRAQQEDSYMPYVTAVGTPLAVGAVAGMGTQSTGQFVNNVANPLAGFKNPFAKKATRVADADNFLPDVPMELNLDVNNPTIDLVRNSPKIKGQRPDYGATDIGNDLTLYNNPSRVSDEASILGKKMAIKSVRDNTSKKSIELKTFIDDAGELKYYMSADMPNRIKAGRAFLELDNHIPIGAKIQEPGSLSFDSLLNVAKQSKNPKFESSISGTVQLNDNAVFNKIKNSGDSNLGKEYYTTVEKAKEGANEVNSLLEKYNLPPAEVKQVIKQDGSPSKVFSIHVPNVVLKKLYSLLGIPTAAAASQAEFKDGGQYTENELAFLEAIKGLPISSRGMYDYPNQKVVVPTSGAITMKGIPHKVIGKPLETGETKTMLPNMEYFFKNTQNVLETPMLQNGGQLVGIKTPEGKEKFISTNSQEYRDYYNANQIASIDKSTGKYSIPLDEVVLSAKRPNVEGVNVKPRERFITEKNTIPSIRPNKEMSIKKDSVLENLTIEQAMKMLPSLEDGNKGVMIGDTFFSRQGELEGITVTAKRRIDLDNIKEGELSNLKKEDTVAIQKKLKDEGYLTPANRELLAPKTKEDIKNVQSMLVKKGYDLGKYGENKDGVDGVMGSKTKGALEDFNNKISGVDGVVGEQTKQAFKNYKSDKLLKTADKKQIDERFFEMSSGGDLPVYQTMLQKQGKFKGIDNIIKPTEKDLIKREVGNNFTLNEDKTCSDNRCTFYVGQEIEKKIKPQGRDRIDAYGDAWTISNRLINKGATEVFSIFDENKPKLEDSQIEPYLKAKVTNSQKVDTSKVKSGDVVNLFYEGSKFKNQAYKEGDKYFTSHAGIVKQDKSGKLFVEHNVGGKIFKDDLEKLSKGEGKNQAGKTLAITAIIRPNYGLSESAEIYDSEKAMVNEQNVQNYNNVGSKEAALFTQTLVKNQEALKKDIPINDEEFDSLVKASKSIGWKESGFKPSVDNSLKKKGAEIRESLGIKEMSRGLTQMKDEMNLAPSLKAKYVKGKGENLNNPTEAAIPTFYALSSRYLYLKDLAVKEGLRLTADEISKLAILGWNEDIARVGQSLKKYKTFDETIKAYRGETGKHQYDLALEAYDKYFE